MLDHAELQTGTEAHATEVSPYGRDVSKTGVRTLLLGATVEMLPLLRCCHCHLLRPSTPSVNTCVWHTAFPPL